MNINELRDYRKWIGKSADEVYFAVRAVGGWKSVFPQNLPRWASKVRNYFNVFPTTLQRVPERNAKDLLKRVQQFAFLLECHEVQSFNRTYRDYRPNPQGKLDPPPLRVPAGCPVKADHDVVHTGLTDSIAVKSALSGAVYLDERNRAWYQMAAGSTIYHWGRSPLWAAFEAAWIDKIRGQNDTPVFKMISPDSTGGSNEVILGNDGVNAYGWNTGNEVVGPVNARWNIRRSVIADPAYQGSYNYSETAQVGLAAHELRDVRPHVAGRQFYVNPKDPFSPLAMRRFPEKDLQGNPLADQV